MDKMSSLQYGLHNIIHTHQVSHVQFTSIVHAHLVALWTTHAACNEYTIIHDVVGIYYYGHYILYIIYTIFSMMSYAEVLMDRHELVRVRISKVKHGLL